MLASLAPLADRLILTSTSRGARPATPPKDLQELMPNGTEVEIVEDLREALQAAMDDAPESGLVIVTGSLYGVGEAREVFFGAVA